MSLSPQLEAAIAAVEPGLLPVWVAAYAESAVDPLSVDIRGETATIEHLREVFVLVRKLKDA